MDYRKEAEKFLRANLLPEGIVINFLENLLKKVAREAYEDAAKICTQRIESYQATHLASLIRAKKDSL